MKVKKLMLQKQPNEWSCLPTAFAIATGIPVEELIKKVGYDGSEILWPEYNDYKSRRSFHPQDFINLFILCYDLYVVSIEAIYQYAPDETADPCVIENPNLQNLLEQNYGVLTGEIHGKRHAVAWDGEEILDPNGFFYPIEKFTIEMFFIIKAKL